MLYIKYIMGWINFTVMILLRLALVLVGYVIIPPVQCYSFWKKRKTLPKLFWLWDNQENSFYGVQWYIDKKTKEGWSLLKISLMWNVVRNPANNLRYLGYGINHKKVDEIVDETTSFMGSSIAYDTVPKPAPVRKYTYNSTYYHVALLRSGWRYYPIFRKVKCLPDGEFYEIRIGFKFTPDWVKSSQIEGYEMYSAWATRTPTVQYAKRPDSYWA